MRRLINELTEAMRMGMWWLVWKYARRVWVKLERGPSGKVRWKKVGRNFWEE